MSGIEFDLNAITNIQSENAAGINLVLGVITENNKINADYLLKVVIILIQILQLLIQKLK